MSPRSLLIKLSPQNLTNLLLHHSNLNLIKLLPLKSPNFYRNHSKALIYHYQLSYFHNSSTNYSALPNKSINEEFIDEKENEAAEEESRKKEAKIRTAKKIFSTILFASTLSLVVYARRRKQEEWDLNLKGCVRLELDENYKGGHKEFYRVPSPNNGNRPTYVLPASMLTSGSIREIQDFEVRESDVFVGSFPKAGTTKLQEIVYLISNDLNFEKAGERVLETRFPYLEYIFPGLSSVKTMESPRLIKTHLPYDLLPKNISSAKTIYIYRNPKDTLVSYYFFTKMFNPSSYIGSFSDFLIKFMKDEVGYAPYFSHLNSYLERKNETNLLVLSYEEMSRSPEDVIRKIAEFLGKNLSDDEISLLAHHTSFEKMSKNPSVNYSHWDDIGMRNKNEGKFMRKGQVGDWVNYFNKSNEERFNAWIKTNNKTNIQFEYGSKSDIKEE